VLLALSTGHKVGLAVVGAVFIVFALASSFLFPRFRPQFPGGGLPAFIVVAVVFFFGMLTAVEVFGAEKEEGGGEHAAESTTEQTTTEETTTEQAPATTTVAVPPPKTTTTAKATTTAKPAPKPQTVAVTETEFKIALPTTQLKAGPVTFDVKNGGKIDHDLVVTGNGITKGTPLISAGQSKTLEVTLKPGKYKLFCSVPGHEAAGMLTNITVA
jgi:uncharacterized cupredoxin-like copper-binding protein